MLVEDFLKEHIVDLSTYYAWEGDQVIWSLFKTGVADDQFAGHSNLQ